MHVAVIDCGSGNLRSLRRALERAGARDVRVGNDPQVLAQASHAVMPGQGAFVKCMEGLHSDLRQALEHHIRQRPLLGICVGMQMMAHSGLEDGHHEGLGWLQGEVGLLSTSDSRTKVPHMGWSALTEVCAHPVLEGIEEGAYVYFAHSYALNQGAREHTLASVWHGQSFPAVVGRDRIIGTQFHPEKSQRVGLRLLQNFLAWQP